MRYAILGALMLSLEILAASTPASAMPANGNVMKANSNVIQVMGGCGKHYHRDNRKYSGHCVPD